MMPRKRIKEATKLRRAGLKYAVGRAIFCQNPKCGQILDMKKAVLVSIEGEGAHIMCESCFTPEAAGIALENGAGLEAWDWERGPLTSA